MDILSTSSSKSSTVHIDRFIGVDTSEMEELDFSSTRFLTVSMFSSINLVRGGPASLER